MHPDMCDRRLLLAGLGLAGAASFVRRAQAGPITPPPGPVGSTGKTLEDVYDRIARGSGGIAEPRVALQDLPGSATAVHVITEPGSYYLTGNVEGMGSMHTVEILAPGVTLDLCGYVLGALNGFAAFLGPVGENYVGLRIVNGTVGGSMRLDPESSGNSHIAVLEDLRVSGVVFARSLVLRRSIVRGNSSGGAVIVQESAVIDQCSCSSTVGATINGSLAATDSEFSGMTGLTVSGAANVRGCRISGFNAPALSISGSDGVIDGNTIRVTGAQGVRVTGSRNLITRNVVQGGSPAYDIGAGNSFGPIANVIAVGEISAVPATQHPWANFIT